MAYPHPSFGYRERQPDPAIDGKRPAYFDEDEDSAILDPAILDTDIMHSPRMQQYRKDSFASNGVLSPPAEAANWDRQYIGCAPDSAAAAAAAAAATNPFRHDQSGFARHSTSHAPSYPHQHPPSHWSFEQDSGQCTPTNGVNLMPALQPFEAPHYVPRRTESAPHAQHPPPPFGPPHMHPPQQQYHAIPSSGDPGFIPVAQVQTPMSPHSHQDWMALAEVENARSARPMPKRMRPHSPPRTVVDLQRRDGIRKKNGRIDIPQERNIHTIDDLIDKTTDEDLLKELKQQKRLLRNREAALASRQRKKKHTEDLEYKEKGYAQQITILEKQFNNMALAHDEAQREKQLLWQQKEEANRVVNLMTDERRDLVMKHTEETSILRKRIQVLTDQLEHGPVAMSAAPSSSGFTDFNAEMEALNMGHDWDNFLVVDGLQNDNNDDFSFETISDIGRLSPTLEKKASSSTMVPAVNKKQNVSSLDQPIASGLLFMLLLCGAFVASNPGKLSAPDLPRMPAEVRAAAPTVLNNLLLEAGSHALDLGRPTTAHHAREPAPSLPSHYQTRGQNKLDAMHRRLTAATKQQERDSAFALTTAQYASLTEMPVRQQQEGLPPPRRNLADALANLEHNDGQSSKAEVYTRSLLWDQIPADVVKQFRDMVRDHEEIEARRHQHPQHHRQQQRGIENDNDDNHDFGEIYGCKNED